MEQALNAVENLSQLKKEGMINLSSLSKLTGFPQDFIKEELLIDDEETLPLEQLRTRMLSYLDDMFN